MSKAIENLQKAQKLGLSIRPKVGGFPYLAEALRRAGVIRNIWHLPSCQSVYLTELGPVIVPGTFLVDTAVDIPPFDEEALTKAIKSDQAGQSTFPEFLKAAFEAGVVTYNVDFQNRVVTYYGILGQSYAEPYPAVEIA